MVWQAEKFKVAETARKRGVRDRVRVATSAEALQWSVRP